MKKIKIYVIRGEKKASYEKHSIETEATEEFYFFKKSMCMCCFLHYYVSFYLSYVYLCVCKWVSKWMKVQKPKHWAHTQTHAPNMHMK